MITNSNEYNYVNDGEETQDYIQAAPKKHIPMIKALQGNKWLFVCTHFPYYYYPWDLATPLHTIQASPLHCNWHFGSSLYTGKKKKVTLFPPKLEI